MRKHAWIAGILALVQLTASTGHVAAQGAGQAVMAYTRPDGAIWTIRADGADNQQLVSPPPGEKFARPRWSPDGSMLVFDGYPQDGYSGNVQHHYVWRTDGTLTALARVGNCSSPMVLPDLNRLAFVCSPSPDPDRDLFANPPDAEDVAADPAFSAVSTTALDGSDWHKELRALTAPR